MTRYYNLKVYYKCEVNQGFSCLHYNLITKDMLDSITKRYEDAYSNTEYVAIQFEYSIVQ